MSNKIIALTAALLMAGATLSPIATADATPRADQRQQNQAQRIRQGVASGELTGPETRRLVKGQRHVHRVERRAKADGDVTAAERLRIEKAQDRQSRRIYRQKHDAQDRN
ncbi:MAG: hypothetical protein R3E65_01965 [Steroidobacteraceae bacterium]